MATERLPVASLRPAPAVHRLVPRTWRWVLVSCSLFGCGGPGETGPSPAAGEAESFLRSLAMTNAKVEQFQFSPDGRWITYVSARNGEYDVWVMNADGSDPRAVTAGVPVRQAFDGPTVQPEWSPDGQWIAYGSRGETYLVRPDGSAPPVNVSYGKGGLRPKWTPDGKWLVSAPGVEQVAAHAQIVKLRADVPSGPVEVRALTDGPFNHAGPLVSPDGRWVAFRARRREAGASKDASGIWLVPSSGGAPRLLASGAGSPAWSPDGKKIAFTASRAGWRNIGVVDVESGRRRMLTSGSRDEGNPQWSPDGEWIAYVANIEWNLHLMKVPAEGGEPQQLTFEPGVNGGLESGQVRGTFRWSPDGESIAYTHMSSTTCSDVWTIPAEGGTPRRITNHMPAGLNEDDLVSPELISYRSRDGLEVPAFLYRPREPSPGLRPPLLVYARANVHGMHVNGFYPFIQLLLSRGYVALAPQVRGSSGAGREFQRLNYGDWGGGDVDDIVAGIDHLVEEGLVDPERVVMQGGSTGGYLTMQTIVRYPARIAAAVNLYGPTNLIHMDDYSATKATLAGVVRGDRGGPREAPDHWRQRSPFFQIDRIETPLLILWGELDSGVRPSMAAEFFRAARGKNKTVDYVLYGMEPHGWYNWRPATLEDAMQRIAAHYANHVGR